MMLSRSSFSSLFIVLTLAACATKAPVPVTERSRAGGATAPAEAAAPPRVARPGHYIVKPGDTLIRIALDHGQNYRDISAWNGLENPNLIEVGQELRVVRPESTAVTRPVAPPSGGADTRPVAPAAAAGVPRRPGPPARLPEPQRCDGL